MYDMKAQAAKSRADNDEYNKSQTTEKYNLQI